MSTIYVSKIGKKIYVDIPSKQYTGAFSTVAKANAFIRPAILAGWHVEYAKDMKKKNPPKKKLVTKAWAIKELKRIKEEIKDLDQDYYVYNTDRYDPDSSSGLALKEVMKTYEKDRRDLVNEYRRLANKSKKKSIKSKKKNPIKHLPPEYIVMRDNDIVMGESDGDDLFLKAVVKHKIGLVIETMKGSQGFPVVKFSGPTKNMYAFLPRWYGIDKDDIEEFASNYDVKKYKADLKKTKGSIAKLRKESLRIRKSY